MGQFRVSKRFGFSASHVLSGLGVDHPCSRLHGHNYDVEIIAEAPEVDQRGFVVDFRDLDAVKEWIDETLDHRHLNDVMSAQPTAENLARFVYEWCVADLVDDVGRFVVAVRVWETSKAYAEYRA